MGLLMTAPAAILIFLVIVDGAGPDELELVAPSIRSRTGSGTWAY
jgi:hypothetical protein